MHLGLVTASLREVPDEFRLARAACRSRGWAFEIPIPNIPGVDANAEPSVTGTTGLTAAVTVDSKNVTAGLTHNGVKITAKAILMTGGFLPVTLKGELTFQPISPGPIGMFVSPLPQSF